MRSPEKHEDFMSHSDCNVYVDDVTVEHFPFGRVEFIDTTKGNGCTKQQLSELYLLYYDTICVAVYNEHPKTNIKIIENFIKRYHSDSTRLSDFIKFDSSISLTINRRCKDSQNENYHYGKYVRWKHVEYSTVTSPSKKIKEELLTTFCKWPD